MVHVLVSLCKRYKSKLLRKFQISNWGYLLKITVTWLYKLLTTYCCLFKILTKWQFVISNQRVQLVRNLKELLWKTSEVVKVHGHEIKHTFLFDLNSTSLLLWESLSKYVYMFFFYIIDMQRVVDNHFWITLKFLQIKFSYFSFFKVFYIYIKQTSVWFKKKRAINSVKYMWN